MLTAEQAYNKAENRKSINQLRKDIEESIEIAASEGRYFTNVIFFAKIPDSVRNKIRSEMESLGYNIYLPEYTTPNLKFDVMKISWEK